jgi:hypothetical protein
MLRACLRRRRRLNGTLLSSGSKIGEYAGFRQWTEAASPVDLVSLARVLQGPLLTELADCKSVNRLLNAIASGKASELHEAKRLELISVSAAGDKIPDDLWCCHIRDNRFWPLIIETYAHPEERA